MRRNEVAKFDRSEKLNLLNLNERLQRFFWGTVRAKLGLKNEKRLYIKPFVLDVCCISNLWEVVS